jgi:multiple sugar transport system substrate-binding protein
MTRRTPVVAAALLTGALVLAGCGGSPGSGDKVTLEFRQFDPPAEAKGLQQAVDTWNAEHPDVQVSMETLGGEDAMQQFAREANSGSGPDVIQIGYVNVKDLASPRVLLPLDDLVANKPPEQPVDDYLAQDVVRYEDKLWALPWTVDTFALAYRADHLSQAGIEPPTTWDQLAADSKKLSEQEKGRSGFCFAGASGPNAGQWFAINYWLWSHQTALVTEDAGRWKVGLTVDQAQQAIDWFNGLFTSGATARSMAAVESINDPQIVDGMTRGSCSLTMMAPQTFRDARQGSDQLLTAPMPDGLTDGATHLGGRALGINASSEHPEESWEFIRFLNSGKAFQTIDQYPASVSTLSEIDAPDGEEGYAKQLPHSVSFGRYLNGPVPVPTLQKIVNREFGAVYSGQKNSRAAAESLVSSIQAELDQQ